MNGLLWRLAGPIYGDIAASVALNVLITACYAGQATCLAFGLAGLLAVQAVTELWWWVSGFSAAALLRIGLMACGDRMSLRSSNRTKVRLRDRLLPQVLALGGDASSERKTGEMANTVVAGVEALETYYGRYIPSVISAVIGCAGIIGYMAWFDARSALVVAVCVLALPITDRLWLRWRRPKASGLFATMGQFAAYMLDSLQGIATLKAFNAVSQRRGSLAGHAAALRREAMAVLYATLMRNGATGLLSLGCMALVVGINASRTAAGTLPALTMLVTLFLAREAFRPLDKLDKTFHIAWGAASAAGPIAALLDASPAVNEPVVPQPLPQAKDLVFDTVTFAWPGSAQPALSEVSFEVRPGEFVAVVGPSGAGKSTLAGLLMRFADPQSGSVRIGGVDLRDLSLRDVRSRVSAVFQDSVLFNGSIEENLRIGRPDVSEAAIREAAKLAHVDAFIDSLPQGYATPVGERGAWLSGGQRQRIAIARAWLKDAPILLLDEATSNIDVMSEQAIQASIEALSGRRSLLVIAHRLATVRKADRILVLDRGGIVEAGNHAALLALGGLYARMYALQSDVPPTPALEGALK